MAKILIVDDSASTRLKMRILLTQLGHTVVSETDNGLEAFTEYRKHMPDLVMMDVMMPGANGIDASEKIIEHYPDAKIIIVSSVNHKHIVFLALETGARHYIFKPFDREKVESVLKTVLSGDKSCEGDTSLAKDCIAK